MFYIELRNGNCHGWTLRYPGETFPFAVVSSKVALFRADGYELRWILNAFCCIPYCTPWCEWNSPWANFIVGNMIIKKMIPPFLAPGDQLISKPPSG